MYRAFLAIILSFLILIGYQYFFVPSQPVAPQVQPTQQEEAPATQTSAPTSPVQPTASPASVPAAVAVDENARDITIDTPLYTVVISEQGGGIKSFVLKKFRVDLDKGAAPMELVTTSNPVELPLVFTLDNGAAAILPAFRAEKK